MTAADPSPRKAAAWMAGWLTAMVVMAVAGRAATRTLHVFQIMEMRSLIGFILLWPLIHANGGLSALRTARIGQQVARNTVHYAAQFGWFFALTLIPIAQVVAIEFTMPIWTALLAVSFLGERLNAARVVAVALGVVGVTVIVRPGVDHVDPGQLIALAAAVGFAVSVILVKSLTRTDSSVTIVFWMLVVQSVIGAVPALLAVTFLGERLSAARVVAVALGVVGVAVIVRPGVDRVDPGQLIALAAAVGFAVSVILVKSLTRTDSAVTIVFWMLVVQSAIGAVPALIVWRTPTAAVWPWVLVIALCGTYSHFCMTQALRHAEATMIVPMDFLRVPLTAAAGWLVYGERIDAFTIGGAAMILFANLLNLRRPGPAPKGQQMATHP